MLTKENYREYPAINYSYLSKLATDPSTVNKEHKVEGDGVTFGDVLDILLTQGQEEFDRQYIVATIERPVGQMGEFVDILYQEFQDDIDEAGEIAYEKVGFKRDSWEKVQKRFEKEGKDYFHFLLESTGKKVIDPETLMKVHKAIDTLKNHEFTWSYFSEKVDPIKNVEELYQLPIEFDLKGYKCKSLLDKVIIDHINKTIQPLDIKTMSDYVSTFSISFQKWKYYLQAAFYTEGLKQKYPDYEIKPFKFIVISSQQLDKPLVYTCTDHDLLVGKLGGINTFTNRKVKGFEQLIDDYIWHLSNDLWEYPREVYEKNGEIELGVYRYEFEEKIHDRKQFEEE